MKILSEREEEEQLGVGSTDGCVREYRTARQKKKKDRKDVGSTRTICQLKI